MTFTDVAPDETDVVIRSLRIQSIFLLARMISIYEDGVDIDKKRVYEQILKTEEGVYIIIYRDLKDLTNAVGIVKGMHACIFPYTDVGKTVRRNGVAGPTMALTWVGLSTKLLAVSSPRGEAAWSTHRKHTSDMLDVIRESAAAMRRNVVTMFNPVLLLNEPFACLSEDTHSTEWVHERLH
ncbi:hypothetical protein Aduo_019119 [Ancylostoma duodenale]